jgi:hypothetical protein
MTRWFSIVLVRMLVLVCVGVAAVMGFAFWFMLRGAEGWGSGAAVAFAFGIPGAAVLLAFLIALPLLAPWRYTNDMNSMRSGGAWAHWRYDEAEWSAANSIEGRRNRRNSYTGAAFALGLGLVILLIGLAVDDPDSRETWLFVGSIMTGGGVVLILTILSTSVDTLARRKPTGEIYISPMGIYRQPGGYVALLGFGVRVHRVEFVDGKPSVVRFDTSVQQRYGTTKEHWADVAVPAGHEDEAKKLVDRFRATIL